MKASPLLLVGACLVGIALLCAIFGPSIAPYPPTEATDIVSSPPSLSHPFGTDASGFDVLSRTIVAARADLVIALTANAISFALGVLLGLAAGYGRSPWARLLVRGSDLLQSFPVFITAMILVALAGRSWTNIILAMTLLYAPIYLRLTRAEVLVLRERGFVEAARAIGLTEIQIAMRHVMPNALRPALAQGSVTIGFAILLTAGLSFVGAGIRPPTPEWGLMIANGASGIVIGDWWPALFPGAAISLTVFGFAALGFELDRRYGHG